VGSVETVTILITDLVGSTGLESRIGPAAAEELRHEHFGLLREVIGEAGGRELKNTGDGLMAAFGSAAATVSCAVSVQQRFERRNRSAAEQLPIKVGVSAGDASAVEGDYFGMPVIEAARLCDRCSGGQILAKELVAHLAAGRRHAFRAVGALELKGLTEPLEAVEVQWEPVLSSGIALPERLRELPASGYVGRVAERERLSELWRQACEGSLRLALISGEAGVGKTRLATYLALQAHGEGRTVLYGLCDEDLGVPYQPWVQALRFYVGEAPRPILERYVARHEGELARLVPDLGNRVSELPSPRQSDPETERYLLYTAAAGLLEVAGEQEPLLVILDDLQWADGQTLSLLRHVVASDASMPVMVVGTYRDSDLSRDHPLTALLADLHREQGVERIALTGLGAEDVLALMEAAAGHELGEGGRALAEEITRESAGNPFFAGELLRHLTESGAIARDDGGRWRLVGDLAELGLRQSVREVIGRRVERLGSDARTRSAPPRPSAATSRSICCSPCSSFPRRACSTCSRRRSRHRFCRRAEHEPAASRSPTRSSSTPCMRISGAPAARGFTSGLRRYWRSNAGMSPVSGWASSPPTRPPRSSAPTPPRPLTTPGEPPSARSNSSPPMRQRAGIARHLRSTSRRRGAIAPSAASC
jgi:class 3 adenylate cyclase